MIVLKILAYIAAYLFIGFITMLFYNIIHDEPLPFESSDDINHRSKAIILFWPVICIFWIIETLFETINWFFRKCLKKNS